MAHFIRLRGAWNVEREEKPDRSCTVKLSRLFGCSAGLQSASRVWLSIEDIAGCAWVELNGTPLGLVVGSRTVDEPAVQRCPAKFEIAALLRPRNVLVIEMHSSDGTGEPNRPDHLGLVKLEIE
jgi:hypothetical protein